MAKKTFLFILVLLGLVLIASLFFPNTFTLKRQVEIDAPVSVIFPVINKIDRWKVWDPWQAKDTSIATTYGEITTGKGATRSWKSENSGGGKITFLKVETNKEINSRVDMADFDAPLLGNFYFKELEKGTEVTWEAIGQLPWPMNLMSPLMGKLVGSDYEEGLANLKKYIENAPQDNVSEVSLSPRKALVSSKEGAPGSISKLLGKGFMEVMIALASQNAAFQNPPFAIYHTYTDERVIMDAGGFFEGNAVGTGGISLREFYSGKTVMLVHNGGYTNLKESHAKLKNHLKYHQLEQNGSPFEFYVDDPGEVGEENATTEIYYPIK